MKKITNVLFIMALCCLMLSCKSKYDGYYEVKIPDENLGTVTLPSNWYFDVDDEWIYVKDIDTKELIAFEYYKGYYYWLGNELFDELQFNPKYDYYIEIELIDYITGNSNLSNCNLYEFDISGENSNVLGIYFTSVEDPDYSIEFLFVDSDFNQEILINITKSYDAEIKS
ncbi:hypothetical protein RJI07_08680 [Mycoplasmatota bacterium WC30]